MELCYKIRIGTFGFQNLRRSTYNYYQDKDKLRKTTFGKNREKRKN